MRYVRHDGRTWRVTSAYTIPGEGDFYDLKPAGPPRKGAPRGLIAARVSECEPHVPVRRRTIRGDGVTLRYHLDSGVVSIRKGRGKGFELTLSGLYTACARQAASAAARDRAFRKRTRKGR